MFTMQIEAYKMSYPPEMVELRITLTIHGKRHTYTQIKPISIFTSYFDVVWEEAGALLQNEIQTQAKT